MLTFLQCSSSPVQITLVRQNIMEAKKNIIKKPRRQDFMNKIIDMIDIDTEIEGGKGIERGRCS